MEWGPSTGHQELQDAARELQERQRNRSGTHRLTPAEARAEAEELEKEVGTDVPTPTACVADAAMEALLDSGATDHTVGVQALSPAQLKGKCKIPEQSYNMATGTIKVTEAVDLYVPALGVVLDFRLLPGDP